MTQKAGGSENGWISAEEDDGGDRMYWKCTACPLQESCKGSKNSFKNACLWSYESEETCRGYVLRHLFHSGVHQNDNLNRGEAETYAEGADIEVFTETLADRCQYRDQLEDQKKQKDNQWGLAEEDEWNDQGEPEGGGKRSRPSCSARDSNALGSQPKAAKGGKGKCGKGKRGKGSDDVNKLTDVVSQLATTVAGLASASSSLAPPPAIAIGASTNGTLIQSNMLALQGQAHRGVATDQCLQMVADSVTRILESIGQATSHCISTARLLNDEGLRLKSALSAIEQTVQGRR